MNDTNMNRWFNSQSRLVQLILLLLPVVNWVVEIGVRWSLWMAQKDTFHLLIAIIYTIFGLPLGWIDLVWVLLFNHLLFA